MSTTTVGGGNIFVAEKQEESKMGDLGGGKGKGA